jgi:hypothetical protein
VCATLTLTPSLLWLWSLVRCGAAQSMPQDVPKGIRTEEEEVEFKWMLEHCNVLYLLFDVLILLDITCARSAAKHRPAAVLPSAVSRGLQLRLPPSPSRHLPFLVPL